MAADIVRKVVSIEEILVQSVVVNPFWVLKYRVEWLLVEINGPQGEDGAEEGRGGTGALGELRRHCQSSRSEIIDEPITRGQLAVG